MFFSVENSHHVHRDPSPWRKRSLRSAMLVEALVMLLAVLRMLGALWSENPVVQMVCEYFVLFLWLGVASSTAWHLAGRQACIWCLLDFMTLDRNSLCARCTRSVRSAGLDHLSANYNVLQGINGFLAGLRSICECFKMRCPLTKWSIHWRRNNQQIDFDNIGVLELSSHQIWITPKPFPQDSPDAEPAPMAPRRTTMERAEMALQPTSREKSL